MTVEQITSLAMDLSWVMTCLQVADLGAGAWFYRCVRQKVSKARGLFDEVGRFVYQPRVTVILPCCGVDEKLEETVAALGRQNYGDYEVIFTFESSTDPAYEAIERWTRNLTRPRSRRVVAGLTDRRSQKIHNLLAAVAEAAPDREVLAFLDSDAVPGEDWLGHLVAPLKDETVGAATGYRWYSAAGGVAAGMRSVWNAATVTLLVDEKRNFCWGGSMAMRRQTFEALQIPRRWDRALSDDLQVTLSVHEAGLRVCFVPQAMIVSSDRTTLPAVWAFAKRQLIITRVCKPGSWLAGLILLTSYMCGGTAAAVVFFAAAFGWAGDRKIMSAALGLWVLITLLAMGKAILRQAALRKVLHPPGLTWRDAWWDVLGTITFAGLMHAGLFFASLRSRRIVWRNTEYELISADETRLIRRLNEAS
jgi:ceramide glucosyltransferase